MSGKLKALDQLKALWKYTSLPIVLLLLVLVAGGSYLQAVAVQIQGQPLVIDVTAPPPGHIPDDGVAHEAAVTESLEPRPDGPLAEASRLIGEGQLEEAHKALRDLASDDTGADRSGQAARGALGTPSGGGSRCPRSTDHLQSRSGE